MSLEKLWELEKEIKKLEDSEEYKTLAYKNRAWTLPQPTEQEKGEWHLLNKKLDELKANRQDHVKIISSINSNSSAKKAEKFRKKHATAIKDERLLLADVASKLWEKFRFDCEHENMPTFEDLRRASGFKQAGDVRDYFRRKAKGEVKEDEIKESFRKDVWIWLIGLDQRVNELLHDTLIENEDGSLRLVLEHDVYKNSAEVAKGLVHRLYGPEKKVDIIAASSDSSTSP